MKNYRVSIFTWLVCVAALAIPMAEGATVATQLVSGNPSIPGNTLVVDVILQDNAMPILGYAFQLRWPATALSLAQISQVGGGFSGSSFGSSGSGYVIVVSAQSSSTLMTGPLFRVQFQTTTVVTASSYSVIMEPYGPSPLITAGGALVPFSVNTSSTHGLGSGELLPVAPRVEQREYPGDMDGDGIPSLPEQRHLRTGASSSVLADTDGDGLDDGVEDTNHNGRRDVGETGARVADSDGDGLEDGIEVLLLTTNPLDASSPGEYVDVDQDGLPVGMDPDDSSPDTDGDRYRDGYEAAIINLAAVSNPTVKPHLCDQNNDGNPCYGGPDLYLISAAYLDTIAFGGGVYLDRADLDRDGQVTMHDFVYDQVYFFGNSALLPAPLRATDTDSDALPDAIEGVGVYVTAGGSNCYLPDSDGDGLSDGFEDKNQSGGHDVGETSGRNRDSDGDGALDGIEVRYLGSDPLNAASPGGIVDADGDELPAAIDPDDNNPDVDGDRYRDGYEAALFNLAAVQNANDGPRLGDVNLADGVSNVDALITQSMFIGLTPPTQFEGTTYADTNRDGSISNVDALIMQSYFLGILSRLPL